MATVGPTNVPAFFSTDSDFRTWGSTISAALATLGLVQTGDTGQINWTTVTKPSATSTAQGYEIWRFADSLQSTTPVYFKIEYGSGGAVDRPSIWITVGSGSTGAGAVNGQTSSRDQCAASTSKTAGASLPFYASGNSGELQLAYNVDTGSNSFANLFSLERTKDSTDTTTSDGVLLTILCNIVSPLQQYIPQTGTVPSSTSSLCGLAPNMWQRSGAGASADAAPIFIPVSGVWRYSHLLTMGSGDFAAGGTLTATIFGGSHTYMSLDRTWGVGSNPVNGTSCGFAIRWE